MAASFRYGNRRTVRAGFLLGFIRKNRMAAACANADAFGRFYRSRSMSFRIRGLSPQPFAELFSLADDALAARA